MEGCVMVDNGRLTEKEARLNMEQCADFLARMIQKYGPEFTRMLQDIAESGEDIDFILVEEMIKRYKKDPAFKNEVLKDGKVTPKEFMTFAKKHNV